MENMSLVEQQDATPAVQQRSMAAVTPGDLLLHALNSGADLDRLERLMEMKERYEQGEARKAYVSDMAQFKLNPPQIVKDKLVGYKNKDGSVTGYTHATLGNVTGAIVEGLARHGFSHRWDTEQQGQQVTVTCILTHRMGHSERTTLTAGKDDSGKKNAIQQMASAVTYLQRYTLLAATGLATQDENDDDGELAAARADMPAPGSAKHKALIGAVAFGKALAAIKAKQYSLAEIEAAYELTPEQREQAVAAEVEA